jgi:hypothetical protein
MLTVKEKLSEMNDNQQKIEADAVDTGNFPSHLQVNCPTAVLNLVHFFVCKQSRKYK